MSDLLEAPIESPTPTLTLAEQVRKIVAEADKPLAFAKVKSALKLAGVKLSGKSKVTDEEIQQELGAEGVFVHPPKAATGKPAYWHTKHVTAEEKAAAKVAEAERKKAEKTAAADSKKAEKAAEADRLKTEAATEKARIAAEKAALTQKKKDDAAAEKARIAAEKEAEKAKSEADATQKRIAAIGESVRAKVETLGKKVVAPEQLFKFTAKHGDAEKAEFERILKQLVGDKKLFEHPGGKYGLAAPLPWFEKFKTPFDALVKAAQKLTANDFSLDDVIVKLREKVGEPTAKEESKVVAPAAFDLADFAKRVMVVARACGPEDRFFDNKVFISAAWRASQRDPHFPKITLAEFKQHLLEANGKHLLHLSQANEVQLMNPQLVKESETIHFGAPFHFILLEGDH